VLKPLLGVFVILHGLVHLWFVVLSQRLVTFQPEMGWTGRSWLLTDLAGDAATRLVAGVAYTLATVAFVVGGTGLLTAGTWWRPVLIGAAAFSGAAILLLWDGVTQLLVPRGIIGLGIDLALLFLVLIARWPAAST
jgi:hypothetical protein